MCIRDVHGKNYDKRLTAHVKKARASIRRAYYGHSGKLRACMVCAVRGSPHKLRGSSLGATSNTWGGSAWGGVHGDTSLCMVQYKVHGSPGLLCDRFFASTTITATVPLPLGSHGGIGQSWWHATLAQRSITNPTCTTCLPSCGAAL